MKKEMKEEMKNVKREIKSVRQEIKHSMEDQMREFKKIVQPIINGGAQGRKSKINY